MYAPYEEEPDHALLAALTMVGSFREARVSRAADAQVKADKEREVRDGHDGTWVAHPALVGVALDIFNAGMRTPNQVGSPSLAEQSHMSQGRPVSQ